ncbi:MAG: ROK family protein [Candidatus Sumerlaeia bacterium]|nr:ROK family protein [Candidatus Sumerlaeia bacterium]
MKSDLVVAIDIGGTHITAAVVNIKDGNINPASRVKHSVNASSSANEILGIWCTTINETLQVLTNPSAIIGYGIAMPGPFDYENGICLMQGLGKYDALYGMNIRTELKKALNISSNIPMIFQADSICFLLGETWKGVASGHQDVIAITLGTGFGSAFMRRGEIVQEGIGLPPGGWFYNQPYREGIADDYFSSRGLLRIYQNTGAPAVRNVYELAQQASLNPYARWAFEVFGTQLAEFLEPWLYSFQPTCLVIGGNISRAWEWFGPKLIQRLSYTCPGIIVKSSELLEDAALLGAALLPLKYHEPASLSKSEQ